MEFNDAEGPPDDEQPKYVPADMSSSIFKVGVRVPPFWPEEPELWFAQIEGQFELSGISVDSTKFNYIISQLDPQHAREVKDIIIKPPATGRYEKLKSELIKRLTASQEKKVKQLLIHEELGDRKPSQFLRHLLGLAEPQVPEDFVRSIWMSRLPYNIQTVLASQATASLDVLSDLADRIQDIAPVGPQVCAVIPAGPTPSSSLDAIASEIAELRRQVDALTVDRNRRSRSRTRQGNRDRSASIRSQSSYRRYPMCWYHHTFGSNASRCSKPCDWEAENTKGSR